jgi:hypothetical protein
MMAGYVDKSGKPRFSYAFRATYAIKTNRADIAVERFASPDQNRTDMRRSMMANAGLYRHARNLSSSTNGEYEERP